MQTSEYQMKAYINDGLNQKCGLDSLEGSAALLQASKPNVDATDIQKIRILDKVDEKQSIVQMLKPSNKSNNTK